MVPSWDVGTSVALKLKTGEEVRGEVVGHHQAASLLVLRGPSTVLLRPTPLRMVRTDQIQSISEAVLPRPTYDTRLPYIDVQRCRDREERAVQAAAVEAAKVGNNVTAEAQQVFNALAKTMPCTWKGRDIVVMTDVLVAPPYDLRSCKQISPNPPLLARIQKVLSNERSKLGLK